MSPEELAAVSVITGVAIGAVLRGVVDARLEDRRTRRSVRAAKRLLAHEFWKASILAEMVRDGKRWYDDGNLRFDHAIWREHKADLAAALNDRAWRVLVVGYHNVCEFEGLEAAEPEAPDVQLVGYYLGDIRAAEEVLEPRSSRTRRAILPKGVLGLERETAELGRRAEVAFRRMMHRFGMLRRQG